MSNSVSFKTRKPIALDQQIKTFGEHKNVPLSQEDALRVVMAGVDEAVIVDDQTGEETPLTMETIATVCPAPNPFFPDEDAPVVAAVDLVTFDGIECFLNGVNGRIYLREDGITVVAAENNLGEIKEYELTAESNVWGGCKEECTPKSYIVMESGSVNFIYGGGLGSDTIAADVDNVSVKMVGGTVNRVFGGGALACRCKESKVDITGGTVKNVYGGGNAGYNGKSAGTKEDPAASLCVVEKANVNVSDITMFGIPIIFGGGMGYQYVMDTEVNLKNVEMGNGYVAAGGANGRTDKAVLTIDGGNYMVVQSINRGSMESAKIIINDGTISKVFAGGEDPESVEGDVVNGFVDENGGIVIELNGGSIEALNTGSNGDAAIEADDRLVSVVVNGAEVANIEDAKVAFGSSLVVA